MHDGALRDDAGERGVRVLPQPLETGHGDLRDEHRAEPVDRPARQVVAFGVDEAVAVGIGRQQLAPERLCLLDPAAEELTVDDGAASSQQPHAHLRARAVEADPDRPAVGALDLGQGRLGGPDLARDRARVQPGMALAEGLLASGTQTHLRERRPRRGRRAHPGRRLIRRRRVRAAPTAPARAAGSGRSRASGGRTPRRTRDLRRTGAPSPCWPGSPDRPVRAPPRARNRRPRRLQSRASTR